MNQSHRKRKPTKKEAEEMLVDTFESKIKEHHIKGMIQGSEVISNSILDFIKDGKDLEYIKNYCESILKSSKDGTMEKVVNK